MFFIIMLFFNNILASENDWDLLPKQRFLRARPGGHGSFFLKPELKTVISSDDGKLKISNEEVVYNGKSISYSQLVKKNPGPREAQFIEIPDYPFLKYYPIGKYIQIEINSIGLNNFSIQKGKDRYSFSAPEKNMYNSLSFDTYFEPGSDQDEILKTARTSQTLMTFLHRLESCAVKKDLECLKDLSSTSFKERLEKSVKRRTVFDDAVTCKKYNLINNRGTDDNKIPNDLVKKADVKKTNLWENLKEASLLKSKNNYILFTNVYYFADEIETVTIIRKMTAMNPCDNYIDLDLTLVRDQEEWKIAGLTLTNNDND